MSGTLEGCIGILHLIAFLPSAPQEESKVMAQRRRSLSAAGSPQAERNLLPFNTVSRLCSIKAPFNTLSRLCVEVNGFRNLIQNKLT